MPTYKVTDPSSGKTVSLTGDSPPTEQELNGIFSQVHGDTPQPQENKPGGLWAALTSKDLDSASKLDPLAQGARLGQFADKGNQEYAALIAKYGNRAGRAIGDRFDNPVGKAAGKYVSDTANIGSTALSTASQVLLPQNRLGVAAYAAEPVMEGYQALKGVLKGPSKGISKPGVVAKLGQLKTKVAAADIQQAIDDPSVFQAPSVAEANTQYGEAMGPLQGASRSLRQQTGKTLLGEADWNEAINRPGRILAGTEMTQGSAPAESLTGSESVNRAMGLPPSTPTGNVPEQMTPQTALEGVQAINRFMRNKVNTAKLDPEQIGELLAQKEQLTVFLENNGTPGMRAAAKVLRKAHVSENLGRIAPVNKSGGTDVLRSMVAAGEGATAASHALSGNVLGAVPYAFDAVAASPAFLGGAIRNYHAISNPQLIGAASRSAAALQALLQSREQENAQ